MRATAGPHRTTMRRPTASTPASSSSTSASSAPFKLLPLWESRPGADPQQYALDRGVVRLLLPEEADARRIDASKAYVPQKAVVVVGEGKQAEDAAQALLAEEDAKLTPAKGGGTAAKTGKKKAR